MADQENQQREEQQHKFEQKIRIIGGIISVLGVAATTVMSIMQVEKQARSRMKKVKGKVVKSKRLTGQATKKKKLARVPGTFRSLDRVPLKELRNLERHANSALRDAEALVKEIQETEGDKPPK